MFNLAKRTDKIVPFHAVEVFKQAQALAAQGHDIISLGIGEPDFTAPQPVIEKLHQASIDALSGYSEPVGIRPLRESIAKYYQEHFGATVCPDRIIITSGASGALMLACMAVIDAGDEVLMPDPSYPANQNFVIAAGGTPKLVECTSEQRFQLDAQTVAANWGPKTKGVLIASPSNPTGTSIEPEALKALIKEVRSRNGFIIMDEIYLGLYYDGQAQSALTLDDNIIIINSFSKYFHMTGWRLGWIIAPEEIIPAMDKMGASLTICAPTLAQHAALACFEPETIAIYEERKLAFKQRRDFLLPAFEKIGLDVPVAPDGAFYIYADISKHSPDSYDFSQRLMKEAGVAAVPGLDFGPAHAKTKVRFSYATSMDMLEEAVHRMEKFLAK